MDIRCKICGRKPEEISEYIESAKEARLTPTQYVILEEGTFNPGTEKFYCTACYAKIGMPLGTA